LKRSCTQHAAISVGKPRMIMIHQQHDCLISIMIISNRDTLWECLT
jgi:hypothetical protein